MEREPDMPPEISVIVPHFENEDGLANCLESLGAQEDAPPFEVIVVDNGSAEPPAATAAEAGAWLAHESVPGPGPARNRGAELARGSLLAFIDSDCVADSGWIAAIAQAFAGEHAPDVIGGEVRIAIRDPARGPNGIEAYESVYGYRQALYVRRDGYTATCNMAVRREVFEAVGPFGGIDTAEDYDWGRRARIQGFRIAYVPEMRIATSARGSFEALKQKWDRHIAHDYSAIDGFGEQTAWILRALALAVSPVGEVVRIWRSPRLVSTGARLRAWAVLARIRLYRASRMMTFALGRAQTGQGGGWRTAQRS